MDKVKYFTIAFFIMIITSSCSDSYRIDEKFIFDETHTVISSINGFIKTKNGFIIYGDADRYVRFQRKIPKGKYFGIIQLKNDGTIDNSFQTQFKIPTSVLNIIELKHGQYLIIYKHFKEYLYNYKMLNMAVMDEKGYLKPINFDFKKIFLTDSVDEEFVRVNAIAKDSSGNIFLAFYTSISQNAVFPLVMIDSNFRINDQFSRTISSNFIKGDIYSIQVQPDNQLLLGGDFVLRSEQKDYKYVCRIYPNGEIDETFYKNLPKFENNDYNRIWSINAIDSTLYIGGNFSCFINQTKISDFIRINKNGTVSNTQPNQRNIFKYVDDEPYFNQSAILSISQVDDSLLFVSGVFNYLNNKKTDVPIALISKNGNVVNFKFKSSKELYYINSTYYKNSDTIYIFGGTDMFEDRNQAFTRFVKRW